METTDGPGKRIREHRERRHWTQEHLAAVSDVNARTIQRIEAGKPASLESLKAIAAAFDIDVGDLVPPVPESLPEGALAAVLDGGRMLSFLLAAQAIRYGVLGSPDAEANAAIGAFLEECGEWIDILPEIAVSERLRVQLAMDEHLFGLASAGWLAFADCKREAVRFGGLRGELHVLTIQIARPDDPSVRISPELRALAEKAARLAEDVDSPMVT